MKHGKKFMCLLRETAVALGIITALYLSFSSMACGTTAEGTKTLDGDFTAPELRECSPQSPNELLLRFSKAVTVEDAIVTQEDTEEAAEAERKPTEDQSVVNLALSEPTKTGKQYRVSGTAVDLAGNSLDFSVPFNGYNAGVPGLALSEVRDGYTSGDKPKSEFIEVYAITAGNLAGMTLMSAYDGAEKLYVFPDVEVKAGEYIVVHCRKVGSDAAKAIDETGTNLHASASFESTDARDLWMDNPDAESRLGPSDILLLRDREGGNLLDALLYADAARMAKNEWQKKAMADIAKEAFEAGLWPDGFTPDCAASSEHMTSTQTLSRQNIKTISAQSGVSAATNGKGAWMVTKTSSASPGAANSSEPYVEKTSKRR
ncbi:MAG: hypothetical protein LBS97_05185 [Treponema sp.]|jgi:hypothetical protein|nr:hypothetical protein [Treponema sp.]